MKRMPYCAQQHTAVCGVVAELDLIEEARWGTNLAPLQYALLIATAAILRITAAQEGRVYPSTVRAGTVLATLQFSQLNWLLPQCFLND